MVLTSILVCRLLKSKVVIDRVFSLGENRGTKGGFKEKCNKNSTFFNGLIPIFYLIENQTLNGLCLKHHVTKQRDVLTDVCK